eukprot:CAMPEP_0202842200 /NCGR_PEP_ID=MMETSP1389-20130828/60786_1 /ASSEMBLY_ACC=CAM_ASM_000865 /TAXON_ID=302021 /ORGANISM="Rhodomonas sp., Strain CCMP768" /LENGTH=197 /DNA_ID=CAMNT_0049519127 /DNA_START=601 /DNA_END=1194 /DNA_ORIENTATION=+
MARQIPLLPPYRRASVSVSVDFDSGSGENSHVTCSRSNRTCSLASFPPSLPPLRRQKFVELVRSERAEDAVAYARKHLAPMARGPALLQVKRPKPSLARALHALCPQANPQPTPSVAVATLCRFVFKRHSQAGAVVRPCHGAAAGRLCNECAAGAVAPLALALRGPHLPQVSNMPGGASRPRTRVLCVFDRDHWCVV